jgi:hypothetical protein
MYCPIEHWQRTYADGWKCVRRRLGGKLPGWLESLACLAWLGPVVLAPAVPAKPAGESPGQTDGPPPGHPERLAAGRPPTPAELELWAGLDGLDW